MVRKSQPSTERLIPPNHKLLTVQSYGLYITSWLLLSIVAYYSVYLQYSWLLLTIYDLAVAATNLKLFVSKPPLKILEKNPPNLRKRI